MNVSHCVVNTIIIAWYGGDIAVCLSVCHCLLWRNKPAHIQHYRSILLMLTTDVHCTGWLKMTDMKLEDKIYIVWK